MLVLYHMWNDKPSDVVLFRSLPHQEIAFPYLLRKIKVKRMVPGIVLRQKVDMLYIHDYMERQA